MKITLDMAARFVCRHCDAGLGPTDPRTYERINESIMRLMLTPGLWQGLKRVMRFTITGHTFTAPGFVSHILKSRILAQSTDGGLSSQKVHLHSQWYEFMDGGVGLLDGMAPAGLGTNHSSGSGLVVDRGDVDPVQSQPATLQGLYAVSTQTEAADLMLTVYGQKQGVEVWSTNGSAAQRGILLPIGNPGWSTVCSQTFDSITHIVKPRTKGLVSLWSSDGASNNLQLATYYPDEVTPSFKKYWVDAGTADTIQTLVAMVKVKYAPALYPDEPLLIQNLPALKAMCQAIKHYDGNDLKAGQGFEQMARGMLSDQLQAENPTLSEIDMESDAALGNVNVF